MGERIKLTVAYLGTPFHGWQRQPDARTVQGELEKAVARLTKGTPVAVVGAGRTDAGVHAAGQVAHLDLPVAIPPPGLVKALNAGLPPEIRVRNAVRVPSPSFHARRSARAKHYAYRARWAPSSLPWVGLRTACVAAPRAWDALAAAVDLLPGYRDMASFSVPDPSQGPTIKNLFRVWYTRSATGAIFHFVGSGFLRYQVRRMVGALFEVAWNRRSLAGLGDLLDHPQAGAALWTAPSRGLTMEHVYYRSGTLPELC